MIQHLRSGLEDTETETPPGLSPREIDVLQLLVEGLSNEEIGARLHINPDTVRTYRQRIMDKLGIHSRAGLVRYVLTQGLPHSPG